MGLPQFLRGTTAAIAIYLLILFAVLKTSELARVPKVDSQHGLKVSEAWQDLHVIATQPHPYNSQANEQVHAYLLERLQSIAASYSNVHVVDDRVSNASFEEKFFAGKYIYFEGTNILVKVDGTAGDDYGAVLFSAHYDSVPMSSGATDDGMGIVSMLQMVEKLAQHPTKRTAIFNFNNGEENGLCGAHAWVSKLTGKLYDLDVEIFIGFLSIPGPISPSLSSISKGRALEVLFRGTSTKPLEAFHHRFVHNPHGTVLAADAFAAGIIRSGTDYTVYANGGKKGSMEGADLAFYRGRSHYHTKYDAIPFLVGGERALWSMMETLDTAGHALLDQDRSEPAGNVAYFDCRRFLLILMGMMLILCKFWFGFILVVISQAGLVFGYMKTNKYVVYSSPYVVLGVASSLVYVVFSLIIQSECFLRGHLVSSLDPNALLLQLVSFYYLIILATTSTRTIGATYLFTISAACAFIAWIIGAVNGAIKPKTSQQEATGEARDATESTPLIERSSPKVTSLQSNEVGINVWLLQLFITVPIPVILMSHIALLLLESFPQGLVDGGPVTLVYVAISLIAVLLVLPLVPFIASYPQSAPLPLPRVLQYANNPTTLFRITLVALSICVAYSSGLIDILLTPTASPATRMSFPFSINTPMKVFFEQKVEIIAPWLTATSPSTNEPIEARPMTYLTGLPYYTDNLIVPALPSTHKKDVNCPQDGDRKGLVSCSWLSGQDMLPSPGKEAPAYIPRWTTEPGTQVLASNAWIQSSIQRTSANTRRFWISGTNSRTCRIYFDNAKVDTWHVVGGTPGVQKGFEGFDTKEGKGITELRMYSRTWDREFVVDITFQEAPEKIKGKVSCEWAEFESGMVGLKSGIRSKIPAFEEVLRFFPRWAALHRLGDFVTEVWTAFES
ncbi:hypothetical protein H0H93_013025 [Arthromyces matolae]|nr:hypothetical protein H0H93_013025 [Arthromyces matolae]